VAAVAIAVLALSLVEGSAEESPNCAVERPLGTVVVNSDAEQSDGKCNRKIPPKPAASPWDGKGEMVR